MSKINIRRIHLKNTSKKTTNYVELEFKDFLELNSTQKQYWTTNVWFEPNSRGVKRCREFISYVHEIEQRLNLSIEVQEGKYNTKEIIALHLKVLDNIQSGLDVRSHLTTEEVVQRILDSWCRKYNESFLRCKKILEDLKANPIPYIENWKEFDKYKMDAPLYNLPLPHKLDEFYGKDLLDSILGESNKLLGKLIEERKNK